jgi:hypothetical protein
MQNYAKIEGVAGDRYTKTAGRINGQLDFYTAENTSHSENNIHKRMSIKYDGTADFYDNTTTNVNKLQFSGGSSINTNQLYLYKTAYNPSGNLVVSNTWVMPPSIRTILNALRVLQVCIHSRPSSTPGWVWKYPETSKNFPKMAAEQMHGEHEIEFWSLEKKRRCQYVALLISRFAVNCHQHVSAELLMEYPCEDIFKWLQVTREERVNMGYARDLPGVTPPLFPQGPCTCCSRERLPKKQKTG